MVADLATDAPYSCKTLHETILMTVSKFGTIPAITPILQGLQRLWRQKPHSARRTSPDL
jgi:hypothetical protein